MSVSTVLCISSLFPYVVVAVVVSFVVKWVATMRGKKRLYPPGPAVYPLIGSIPYCLSTSTNPLNLVRKMASEFGDVAYLRLMGFDIVLLSDNQVIKEFFHREDCSFRATPVYNTVAGCSNFGLVSSSGRVCKDQRQITHSFFQGLGVAKKSFEPNIALEASMLMEELRKKEGAPFDPKVLINNAVSNVICSVVFGSRHDYTDPVFNALLHALNSNLQISMSGGLLFFMHSIAWIPHGPGYQIRKNVSCIIAQMKRFVDEHRHDHVPGQPRDMIDMYIDRISEVQKSGEPSSYTETNMLFTLADIFAGGSETTTSALRWIFLRMISNPEVQSKVQAEIDNVVGRARMPCYSDRPSLPYTEAVIWEVLRLHFIIPLGVPHQYSGPADTSIHGYHIPQGALVLANFWTLSRDPVLFPDPEAFKPERFLNEEGQFVKPDDLMPFSVGKRFCIGEALAKKELFIFFSHLVHRFTFKFPDGVSEFPLEGSLGAVYVPERYHMCAVSRD